MIAVVDLVADVGQVADREGVHPGLIASLHKIPDDQVEQMVDLAGLLALDLAETFRFTPVFQRRRFDIQGPSPAWRAALPRLIRQLRPQSCNQ